MDQSTTNQVADFMEGWQKEQNQRLGVALVNRQFLHTILTGLGVTQVTCAYSGYGDSGQIDEVRLFGGAGGSAILDAVLEQEVSGLATMDPGKLAEGTIKDALEEMFWELLMSQHAGFENNEGGQGDFEWLLEDDDLRLDHGDNVIEIAHTDHTF